MPVAGEIVRVAARGDGVTADGRHAPLAAPGDVLGEDGALSHGPHHRTPPCRHFPQCGGCQLQHLDDASYAGFVEDRVATALAAQQLHAPIRPALLSPPRTRRRATLHAERRGDAVAIGFVEAGSTRIVDMRECHVLAPALFDTVAPLRRLLRWLGGRKRMGVALTLTDQGVDVTLSGTATGGLTAEETLADFARDMRLARLALDDGFGAETRWEPRPVTVTQAGVPVPFPPGGFLQATADGEAQLVAAAREIAAGAATVADLFAGLGTFALALPARVYAAEGARDAVLALKSAAARAGRTVVVEHRDLYRRPLAARDAGRFDAVLLDPPRAGAEAQVRELAASSVPVIGYISCNPSSFARDAKLLVQAGWRIDWIQPVGQFRWSTHVELAARLSRQ